MPRPVTFAQALDRISPRASPSAEDDEVVERHLDQLMDQVSKRRPVSLDDLEERLFRLLEREVGKLRPASMRVSKIGRKISAQRRSRLKQALALIDDVISDADAAPDGQVDIGKWTINVLKAAALVAAAVEDPSMAPVITNLRKRAAQTLDQLAERERLREPSLTREAAYAKALATPEGADAYGMYDAGVSRGEPSEITPPEPVAKGIESAAWSEIVAKADALVTKSAGLTREAAIAKVITEHPVLYSRYEAEQAGR